MLRYNRSRYIALGLPSLCNAASLFYLLKLKTDSMPSNYIEGIDWFLVAGLALFGASVMIKRARDIGSSAWGILLGFLFAPPFMLLVALVLSFIPSNPDADRLEAPSPPASRQIWLIGLSLLCMPWIIVLLLQGL